MRITMFGTGYVGLVTGACFAESGNKVCCVDIDVAKVDALRRGEIPIYEPGLAELVEQNTRAGRLTFTTDAAEGIEHGVVLFIAVGTPPQDDGSSDLRYVIDVARTIGQHLTKPALIVDKSTVPVGTADLVRLTIQEELDRRGATVPFDVVSNPEFLKEGAAIDDFMKPDRIVIGAENPDSIELMKQLYSPFNRNHNRIIVMDTRSAELTKYAANGMLAVKISFMNEIANIAERAGANIESVRIGIGADSRIGYNYIYAGIGYGGSCLPKDVRALEHTALNLDYKADLLHAVEAVNGRQKRVLLKKILDHYDGDVRGRTFAFWGLSFKPKTDDIRDAPSREIMEGLWAEGARVRAFDPESLEATRRIYGDRPDLTLCETRDETLQGADALVICTEWRQFKSPDWDLIRESLSAPVIFDGRNIYDPVRMAREGFTYYGIGLGDKAPEAPAMRIHTSPLLAQAALAD
jgi:UDPglucose 6-dehydrogenase